MSLTQEIESRIQRFVGELNDLVRKQALEAVSSALGSGPSAAPRATTGRRPGRPPGRPAAAAAAPSAAPAAARGRSRRKGEKRSPAELEALETRLHEYVRSNPGQGIEAIGKALSIPTGELSRPMKKLIGRNAIRTVGVKRATKYFGGDGSATTAAAPAPKKRGRPAGKKKAAKKR